MPDRPEAPDGYELLSLPVNRNAMTEGLVMCLACGASVALTDDGQATDLHDRWHRATESP